MLFLWLISTDGDLEIMKIGNYFSYEQRKVSLAMLINEL